MRAKMDRAERAKQFMPFSALEGLDEVLRERNPDVDERVCLGEDAQAELDRRLRTISPGREICAVFYTNRRYSSLSGTLRKIDPAGRHLQINDVWVAMDDLLDVRAM